MGSLSEQGESDDQSRRNSHHRRFLQVATIANPVSPSRSESQHALPLRRILAKVDLSNSNGLARRKWCQLCSFSLEGKESDYHHVVHDLLVPMSHHDAEAKRDPKTI